MAVWQMWLVGAAIIIGLAAAVGAVEVGRRLGLRWNRWLADNPHVRRRIDNIALGLMIAAAIVLVPLVVGGLVTEGVK